MKVAHKVALAVAFSFGATQASATTVIGFDNIPEGTIAANQYNGVTISGGSVLTQASQLNTSFPPFSVPNVVYDYLDGTIMFDFTTPVDSIGAYVTTNTPITLKAFSGTTLLGTAVLPSANYTGAGTGVDPNYFLNLSFAGITSALFTNSVGLNNTFTLDDVTVGGTITVNSAVPEPATWMMMIAGLGIAGASIRYRRQSVRLNFA